MEVGLAPAARVLVWLARVSSEADAGRTDHGLAGESEEEDSGAEELEEIGQAGGEILKNW